jgi:site-specific recombinase XerD
MTQALTITPSPGAALIPPDADKHSKYRLKKFTSWLGERSWLEPDLSSYRDHLLENYMASTVSAHLSTVRGRYQAILRDNSVREMLYRNVPDHCEAPADQKAFVDETLDRLKNAVDPGNSAVQVKKMQDRPDSDHLRLTREQAEALMGAPGTDSLKGLRDTAIISLMLCAGIREAELCALEVPDLRQRLGGELALCVREGKGCKQRLVPYGSLSWVLVLVDAWLQAAGIEAGPVFRSFWKGGALRGRLSVRAVQNIVTGYPIAVDGQLTTVRPHDCRRTYAKALYSAGLDPVALQQNMGHASLETTLSYVGVLSADQRRPPSVYNPPDLAQLAMI